MLKKILSVLLIGLFCIFSLPFFSNAADSRPLLADCVVGSYSITSCYYFEDGYVSELYFTDDYDIDLSNGSDILISSDYDTAPTKVSFIYLGFVFNDINLVNGQSYRLSFTTNNSAPGLNYTYGYMFDADTVAITVCGNITLQNCKPIGSTNVYPNAFNSYFLNEVTNIENLAPFVGRVTSSDPFSVDINIPVDGFSNVKNDSGKPLIPYYLIIQNTSKTDIVLQDVKLEPVGATRLLYADKEFQNNVQDSLDEIESGLFGPGETYPPLDHEDDISEFIEQEGEYNKDYSDELEDQLGSAGSVFDNNGSFAFLSAAFDDLILSNTSINGLILFSLGIGLCVLILGRRLNA